MKDSTLHCSLFLTLTPDLQKYTKSKLRKYNTTIAKHTLTPETLDPKTEVLGVFVDSKVTKHVIDALPKLKLIVTLSTGFDHIDLRAAKKRGIRVCSVPSYGEDTVAEYTIALMLSLSRKLYSSTKRVKEGQYDYHGLRGFDLKEKTIGIVGTGKIGIKVIEKLQGFGMNILAYDVYKKKDLAKSLQFTYTTLPTLLKTADIVSLHTPLLPTTKHMINKRRIKQMKPGSYLINTARGGLVDSSALLWGLQNNIIEGAALDVLDEEDILEDPRKLLSKKMSEENTKTSLCNMMLIEHPRTIVTPHNAFNSIEAIKRIIDTSVDNIHAFAAGNPQNTVC